MSRKETGAVSSEGDESTVRKRERAYKVICAVGIAGVAVLTLVGFKKGVLKVPKRLASNLFANAKDAKKIVENSKSAIADMQIDFTPPKKTGEMLTARGIGDKMLVSAQEVNRRLIEKGLATRMPYGVIATEEGARFGKEVVKTTRYGHTFSNFEWDSSLIDVLFSKDDFDHVAKVKQAFSSTNLS